jgi:aminoglycoside/choline kinase family phosphotransferase
LNSNTGSIELIPSQINFCKQHVPYFTEGKWQVSVAGKAGSDRSFLRISPASGKDRAFILVIWDSQGKDWERFFRIYKQVSQSLSLLPEIYASDKMHGLILEEDCGPHTLKDFCYDDISPERMEEMYKKVIDALIIWQNIEIEEGSAIASRTLDKDMLLWETDYFATHCVREYFGLNALLTPEWESERNRLADDVAVLPIACLHRDFQSENILVQKDTLKLVDYQGARLGPAEYDTASLLFDPYVSVLTDTMRYQLLDYYIEQSGRQVTYHTLRITALQRLTQALGAYGNLSLHKGKERYKKYVPFALRHLSSIMEYEKDYPCLNKIVEECLRLVE